MAKTRVVYMTRGGLDYYYLWTDSDLVCVKMESGFLVPPIELRCDVYLSDDCRERLGLPAVRKGAQPVCIEWTVKPVPKAKKKAAKKTTKKKGM